MHRRLFALASLFVTTLSMSAQEAPPAVKIRWCGQSFFQVTATDGTRVVFDPHAMPEYGRQVVSADLVLLSHLHNDHSQWDVLENADALKKQEAQRVINGLNVKKRGRAVDEVKGTVGKVTYRNVGSFHDADEGMKRGLNSIFVVEVDGLKIVHLGDLGHVLSDEQVRLIGEVDILMIPIGGIYTINGGTAREVVKQLKPRLYVLPMHYGTKATDATLLDPTEFLDGQKNVRKIESNLLSVPVNLQAEAATIVLMGFESK